MAWWVARRSRQHSRWCGAAAHVVIGFPPAGNNARVLPLTGSGPLSFSGEGHEIWRNSAPVTTSPEWMHPRRPIYPVYPAGGPVRGRPIFGAPVYGYGYGFGYPFFGFGWGGGLGWGAGWGLGGCDPYWTGGVGCGLFPYYDYGYGDYGNYGGNYSAGNVESQIESQQGPSLYGNGSAPIVYGGNQLVQLYLKDGTVYDVTDYWLVNDNDLHFTTVDASGNATRSCDRIRSAGSAEDHRCEHEQRLPLCSAQRAYAGVSAGDRAKHCACRADAAWCATGSAVAAAACCAADTAAVTGG